MKIGQEGLAIIKQFEGCRLQAYKCPAGVWTIGYGHTGGVVPGQTITQAQADALLVADLEKFEKRVGKYNAKYRWSQKEFDALVSFAFNLGSIDQLTAGGTRSRAVIADKMLLYNKAGGKVLAGLTRRRKAEREMFMSVGSTVIAAEQLPILKIGSRGENVKLLQQILNEKGYCLIADGIFGSKTLEAVKAFQKANGLVVDGVVGMKTWSKLNM